MKPLIGITGSGISELPVKTKLYDAFHSVPSLYVECVARAGGIPVILPPIDVDIVGLLAKLDGLLFCGGADLHPAHYEGDDTHEMVQSSDEARDSFELKLMKQAIAMQSLPILGICRGAQVLNVALGGNLHEHLPDHIEDDIHRNESGGWISHDVDVSVASKLHHIMKAETVHTVSGHHQALARIAPALTVVASAADDVVEAVEMDAHPWCIAVQWHPERTAESDATQQNLFNALVEAARG